MAPAFEVMLEAPTRLSKVANTPLYFCYCIIYLSVYVYLFTFICYIECFH